MKNVRQVAEAVEAEQDAEAVGEAEENAEEELRKAEEELRYTNKEYSFCHKSLINFSAL